MFDRRIGWRTRCALVCAVALGAPAIAGAQVRYEQLRTANGVLEGVVSADGKVRTFKGIPYAAPPVGELRWKPPRPAPAWAGVRKAADYPPRCMQGRVYSDMVFNDKGPSEDCLYLNLLRMKAATGRSSRWPTRPLRTSPRASAHSTATRPMPF